MIVDFKHFIDSEQVYWTELEDMLDALTADKFAVPNLAQARRLHYLYERAGADLARLAGFSSELDLRVYLESLVARAHSEIHETRRQRVPFHPLNWFFGAFPRTFRKHLRAFFLCLAICLAGGVFGGVAVMADPEAKAAMIPFSHLAQSPNERVAREEEEGAASRLAGRKSVFSAQLIQNNTRVSFLTLALGMTYGIGTCIVIFYNGVILGAVAFDYILAGQTTFLAGWLLPHGSIEIPAILLAGQASFVLARALIGWGQPVSVADRLRAVTPDLATLVGGVCVMLIWAGLVEAFFSQYHEPVLPYAVKILFGMGQLTALIAFLVYSGRRVTSPDSSLETV
ncbi:MAG: stage II sporulation protein M [Lentisphaeria bacterium]|nr:stage II sporulation protein M [Lentisphaeria bacterium]